MDSLFCQEAKREEILLICQNCWECSTGLYCLYYSAHYGRSEKYEMNISWVWMSKNTWSVMLTIMFYYNVLVSYRRNKQNIRRHHNLIAKTHVSKWLSY